jgi:hypothetical protein
MGGFQLVISLAIATALSSYSLWLQEKSQRRFRLGSFKIQNLDELVSLSFSDSIALVFKSLSISRTIITAIVINMLISMEG